MPIQHVVWTVSNNPVEIPQVILPSERMVEEMIVSQPRILQWEWMLIGRQPHIRYIYGPQGLHHIASFWH